MKSKILGCLSAAVLGAAIALPTQALAFRGGSVGGMHGGFGGGGMHFGGGFGGGGMRFGGGGFGGGGFRGGMVTGRSAFAPAGNRFVGAPFAGRRVFVNRFNNFNRFNRFDNFAFRHHHRFRNFGFFGEPFFDDYAAAYGNYDYAAYGNGCWRQESTGYAWQWGNVCYGYNY